MANKQLRRIIIFEIFRLKIFLDVQDNTMQYLERV
ncbi:hypothetical protein T12_1155 [Trichinella patagoniensis]|uniref:Uncharacterized protein n=1 Tax=Trichinella patagoniensis TaxID=990121 RepID=A0A0V0YY11_9BILA|nr:hypothetical protein T12_1155 [Trichinella patagoniensis]